MWQSLMMAADPLRMVFVLNAQMATILEQIKNAKSSLLLVKHSTPINKSALAVMKDTPSTKILNAYNKKLL